MKIIDAHIHFSNITVFKACAEHTSMVDYSLNGYEKEARESGVTRSVCMGLIEDKPLGFPDKNAKTPMAADLAERLPSGVSLCYGANPHTLDKNAVAAMEDAIAMNGKHIAGFKIYAGYYYTDVYDPVYDPVYKLAIKSNLPVVVHTGETYSERGLLELSHPLRMDRLAVKWPDLKLVLCHMGAPWVFDACEVAGKNRNVYIDLSGLLVKDAGYINAARNNRLITDRYMQPLALMDNYEKVLFGTDWPLAPMGAYVEFIKTLIPPDAYELVFYKNAVTVFNFID